MVQCYSVVPNSGNARGVRVCWSPVLAERTDGCGGCSSPLLAQRAHRTNRFFTRRCSLKRAVGDESASTPGGKRASLEGALEVGARPSAHLNGLPKLIAFQERHACRS